MALLLPPPATTDAAAANADSTGESGTAPAAPATGELKPQYDDGPQNVVRLDENFGMQCRLLEGHEAVPYVTFITSKGLKALRVRARLVSRLTSARSLLSAPTHPPTYPPTHPPPRSRGRDRAPPQIR